MAPWYSEPQLLQINNDYHSELIDKATMFARAKALQSFRPWLKETLPDGRLRYICPGRAPAGRGARCNCELLEGRTDGAPEVPFPPGVKKEDSVTADPFRRDLDSPGLLCTEGSIVVDPRELVMVWQADAHRTPDWRKNFAAGRNATERGHSHAKAGYGEALGIPDRRGVKGKASARFLVALLLGAHSLRLTRSWLRNAERDENGIIIRPPLKNRRGTRRPWHSPRPPSKRRKPGQGQVKQPGPAPPPPEQPVEATVSFS